MGILQQSVAEMTRHGSLVLFVWITAERLGAPVPAVPILVAAGVLSAAGQMSPSRAFVLGVLGCLIGDAAWYGIGRRRGSAVLRVLCKMSLEPETCVRRTSDFVSRHGGRALLVAKFIPGVGAVAVPLAASSGLSLASFLGPRESRPTSCATSSGGERSPSSSICGTPSTRSPILASSRGRFA